jgi:hypothetical protein
MLLLASAEMLLLMAARAPDAAVMVAPACSKHSSYHVNIFYILRKQVLVS